MKREPKVLTYLGYVLHFLSSPFTILLEVLPPLQRTHLFRLLWVHLVDPLRLLLGHRSPPLQNPLPTSCIPRVQQHTHSLDQWPLHRGACHCYNLGENRSLFIRTKPSFRSWKTCLCTRWKTSWRNTSIRSTTRPKRTVGTEALPSANSSSTSCFIHPQQ